MIWKAIAALLFSPAVRVPVHDENVHRLRNAAANAIAGVEIAARQSRTMTQQLERPEHLEDKIREANRLTQEMRRMIGPHTDPDDGLLRGMDSVLKKDGER